MGRAAQRESRVHAAPTPQDFPTQEDLRSGSQVPAASRGGDVLCATWASFRLTLRTLSPVSAPLSSIESIITMFGQDAINIWLHSRTIGVRFTFLARALDNLVLGQVSAQIGRRVQDVYDSSSTRPRNGVGNRVTLLNTSASKDLRHLARSFLCQEKFRGTQCC